MEEAVDYPQGPKMYAQVDISQKKKPSEDQRSTSGYPDIIHQVRKCVTAMNLQPLCMKFPWFCHTNIGQLFCNCLRPIPLFGGKSSEGSKVIVTLLLPQIAESSDTQSSLFGENE